MKSNRVLLIATLAALLAGAAGYAWLHDRSAAPAAAEAVGVPAHIKDAIGAEEDPQARARYEWMRLHDPALGRIPAGIRGRELAYARTLPVRDAVAGKAGLAARTWVPRGPVNLGGRTRALGVDVSDPNVLLAGGVSGGMWRSEDGGLSWTQTTDPGQHPSVTALAQDTRPGKTDTWYYGSGELIGNSASAGGYAFYTGTGVYKSTDGGRSWQRTALDDDTPAFDNVAEIVNALATDPSNQTQDEVYAAVYGVIYRSTSSGAGWTPVLFAEDNDFSPYTDVAVTPDGVVYATMGGGGSVAGLWRSPDGVSWTEITPAGWPPVFTRTVAAVAPSDPNVVYFLAHTPGGAQEASLWKYTYVSGDGSGAGGTWEDRSANLPADDDFDDDFPGLDVGGLDLQGGYNMVVDVKPDDPDVVFVGGTNLYRSTDGFTSEQNTAWIAGYHPTSFLYPDHHPDQHALVFHPTDPQRAFTGSDGGVHATADVLGNRTPDTPVLWASLNNGYLTTQFYSVAIDNVTPGDQTIVGGMQDNGTFFTNKRSGKDPWVGDLLGGDGAFADIADARAYYYVSAQQAQIYRLRLDADGTLLTYARVDPPEAQFGVALFITPFMLDPVDTDRMFLGGGNRVWRNHDLTTIPAGNDVSTLLNWDLLENTGGEDVTVSAVNPAAVPGPAGASTRLYYATFRSTGEDLFESRVLRVDDAWVDAPVPVDVTWESSIPTEGFPQGAYVSCIASNPNDPDEVLVVFSNYGVRSLFYSADGGASWSFVAGNLEENPDGSGSGPSLRWAEIVPRLEGTTYFVATSTGLYSTSRLDGNLTIWMQEGEDVIGDVVVDMIDARAADGFIVAGTHGTGVYSSVVEGPVAAEPEPQAVPETFALSAAYPNPFNPATRLTLSVARTQPVRVDVYDGAGRRVATLFDGRLAAGAAHPLTFDAGGLPSGVYFVRARGTHFSATRQVVLAK